jgi:glyoxylase-like metal-dependent hydrolase (beta-lactamase superfamily II)
MVEDAAAELTMIKRMFVLTAGFCRHPECVVIRGGSLRASSFPASVVVLEHAREGIILFDTGYSEQFRRATSAGIERMYALTTPMTVAPGESAVEQLASLGIKADDVRVIILSHFHADHIAGLSDFPAARIVYKEEGWQKLNKMNRVAKLCRGFLPGLLPSDFRERSRPIANHDLLKGQLENGIFSDGYDVLGDLSVLGVDLPGHAIGQMGMMVAYDGKQYFFVADAAWMMRNIAENRPPSRVAQLIMDDHRKFKSTLTRLHQFQIRYPEVRIVPCHCSVSLAAVPELLLPRSLGAAAL